MEAEIVVSDKQPRSTAIFFNVPAERPILATVCSGGAGANAAKFMINEIDPEEDQTARLAVIESNGPVLVDHFRRSENPKDPYTTRLFKWFDSGRFKIFPIGKGLGAGGNPEAGKEMFKPHLDAVMEFIQGADSVVQVGGAGGGTASGVMPVLAQALSDASISMYSIIAYPRFDEGQDKIAKATLVRDLLTEIGPTTSVHNENIDLALDGARHLSEIYRDIDHACLYPVLRLTRWLSQETGDVQDLDKSDFKNYLAYGNYILPGFFDASKGLDGFEQAFLENRFLDTRIIENAAKLLLCYRGPWTYSEQNRVKDYLTGKMKQTLSHAEMECKSLVKEKGLPKGTKTVGFIAVAKEGPAKNQNRNGSSVAILATLPATEAEVGVVQGPSHESDPSSNGVPLPADLDSTPANEHANGNGVEEMKTIRPMVGQDQVVMELPRSLADAYEALFVKPLAIADTERALEIQGQIASLTGKTVKVPIVAHASRT